MMVRPATAADAADIARVHVAAWDAAKEGLDLPSRPDESVRSARWTAYLGEQTGNLLVVQDGEDAIVGFIAFGLSRDANRQGECEIYTLYVDPDRWSRGVGSTLLAQVPHVAPVSLWVAERNARARSFYARHGFVADGAQDPGHHVPVMRVVRPPIG